MRLFIGVELDEHVRAAAASAADALHDALAHSAPDLRAAWIKPDNMHLTLWFIGEVSGARADGIADALRAAPFAVPAFDLSLGGFGVFPPSGAPRVLWIGVQKGGSGMAALYHELGARLVPLGFEPERRAYTAHLTIARIKEPGRTSARRLRDSTAALPAECGVSRIAAVTLFRSHLSPRGAVYEPLLRVPLS